MTRAIEWSDKVIYRTAGTDGNDESNMTLDNTFAVYLFSSFRAAAFSTIRIAFSSSVNSLSCSVTSSNYSSTSSLPTSSHCRSRTHAITEAPCSESRATHGCIEIRSSIHRDRGTLGGVVALV
jgi:hypothetical protein